MSSPAPQEQAKAQRSSVTGHTPGQNLALNLGLPPCFLPLTPFSHTACFLCSPAGQPGLILASGALCPHTTGASRSLGPAGLPGEWRQQCQDIFAQGEGGYTGWGPCNNRALCRGGWDWMVKVCRKAISFVSFSFISL